MTNWTQAQIAAKYKVSPSAMTQFVRRHEDKLEALHARVERQVEDYVIAHKINRIAGLDQLAREVRAYIDEHGLVERSVVTTENAEIVRERFAREVSAEMRALYRAAAEELNQLPKPTSGDTFNIDKAILVRYVESE